MTGKGLIYWLPRVISVMFTVFLSSFALDVFDDGRGFKDTALALAMHLLPSAVMLVVVVLSWRWEWLGAALFAAAGVFYGLNNSQHFDWILLISGPLFVIAALFLLSWLKGRDSGKITP